MGIETKLGFNVFKIDKERHITINTEICSTVCTVRPVCTCARR